jgi:hypothetical protein
LLLHTALVINLLASFVFMNFYPLERAIDLDLTAVQKRFMWSRGAPDLGREVSILLQQYPKAVPLADSRRTIARLMYYTEPRRLDNVKPNPTGKIRDHYDLTTTLEDKLGANFLLITEQEMPEAIFARFETARQLALIRTWNSRNRPLVYRVYYLTNFRGYD